jgi:lipopolysaccharide transport system ATP-binding protein
VAHSGRTVIFVSHNMAAVKSLTTRGVLLSGGQVIFDGPTEAAISRYAALTQSAARDRNGTALGRGRHATVLGARLLDADAAPAANYVPGQPLRLEVVIETDGSPFLSLEAFITDANRIRLGMASLYQFHGWTLPTNPGRYICQLTLEPIWLASGSYFVDVATSQVNSAWDHKVEAAVTFDVVSSNPRGLPWDFKQSYEYGALALLATEMPVFQATDSEESGKIAPPHVV